MLTQDRLKEVLHYDPETGIWTWLVRRGPVKPGDRAGNQKANGYREVCIDSYPYYEQRLAFLYMTGMFPVGIADHKDRARSNNRWSNLRDSTQKQNSANMATRPSNKIGLKGVSLHRGTGKYVAFIANDRRSRYLGLFDCPAAAHFAYLIEADKCFGEFARAA